MVTDSRATPALRGDASTRPWRSLHAVTLLAAAFLGVLWTIDVVSKDAEQARITPVSGRFSTAIHPGNPRVLALIIDSLPHRLAVDPNVMPSLAGLREKATYAETRTTRDAITVSALRAAFTGRERLSPFGVVENFRHGDDHVESLFSQARAAGLSIGVVSDGSFDQFGTDMGEFRVTTRSEESELDKQDRMAREALQEFAEKRHDLQVVHVTYGDHLAHRYGARAAEYTETFRRLDRLVADFDRGVSEEDTLVVMGDHGHDEEGRHGPGIAEPTFSLYRGKGFARGLDLGEMPITEHRYLTSFALGLPLPKDYAGGAHPAALVPSAALPADFAAAGDRHDRDKASPRLTIFFDRIEVWNLAAVAAHVGLFCWIWLEGLQRKFRLTTADPDRAKVGVFRLAAMWAVLLPIWFPSLRPLNSLLGLALGAAWLASLGRPVLPGALAALSAVGLAAWGFGLAAMRPAFEQLATPGVEGLRYCAAATGILAAIRWGAMRAGWILLAATALLLHPDVAPYGSVAMLAPVWACWLLLVVQANLGAGDDAGTSGAKGALLPGIAALAFLLPFLRSAAEGGRFARFEGPLAPASTAGWMALAVVAKAVIFLVPARSRAGLLGGTFFVLLLSAAESDLFPLEGRTGAVALVLLIAITAALHAFRGRSPGLSELARVARLGLLFAAAMHFIRVPPESRAWADCLFAALVLSAVCARRSADPRIPRGAPAFLLAMGVIAAGFATLAWSTHRLEWGFLYDWFPGDFVEHRAPLFLPLLVGRYALPVLIVRHLLTDVFGTPAPALRALGLGGIKILALAALILGIGCHSAVSDAYVAVVAQEILFFLLVLGLVV